MTLDQAVLNDELKEIADDLVECFSTQIGIQHLQGINHNDRSEFYISAC